MTDCHGLSSIRMECGVMYSITIVRNIFDMEFTEINGNCVTVVPVFEALSSYSIGFQSLELTLPISRGPGL